MSNAIRTINLSLAIGILCFLGLCSLGLIPEDRIKSGSEKILSTLQQVQDRLSGSAGNSPLPSFSGLSADTKMPKSMWDCNGTFTDEPTSEFCQEIEVEKVKDRKGNKYITREW